MIKQKFEEILLMLNDYLVKELYRNEQLSDEQKKIISINIDINGFFF